MSKRVDLNVDIGEGFPYDKGLLEFATSANIGCGEHVGNWETSLETISLAQKMGRRIGIHPGFPDRKTMGRVIPLYPEPQLQMSLMSQVVRFMDVCKASYIKPHGAWYNLLTQGEQGELPGSIAVFATRSLFAILKEYRLPVMILPCKLTKTLGANFVIREGFADRGYTPTGTLIPRDQPGALLEDESEIRDQVLRLAESVDSICLHGDGAHCVEFAKLVSRTLTDAGYEVGV